MLKKSIGILWLIVMFVVIATCSIATTSNLAMAEGGSAQSTTSQLKAIQDISKEVPNLIKSDVAPFGIETNDATTRENHILLLQSELYGVNSNSVYRYDPVYDVSDSKNTSTNPTISYGTKIMINNDYKNGVAFDPVGKGCKNYIAYYSESGTTIYIVKAAGSYHKIMTSFKIDNCTTDYRRCLAVGDFNGDGKETIVFAGYYLDSAGKSINLTEFNYSVEKNKISVIGTSYVQVNTPRLRVGDINNDGYDDIIVRGIYSDYSVYWGCKDSPLFGDYMRCTTIVSDSFYTKHSETYESKEGFNPTDECLDCVIANFDGKGDALWIVEKVKYVILSGKGMYKVFKSQGTKFFFYKTECNGYKVTVQPCVTTLDTDYYNDAFLTIDAVNYMGDDQKPYLFMDGALYGWDDGTFVYETGTKDRKIQSYAIGNFTCDKYNREQVVYTYDDSTRMSFYNGEKSGDASFSNKLNALVTIDDDNDSEIVKFNDKFFAYSEPEVLGILQAAPYYSELNNRDYQDVGWTQFTIEQSFTSSSTQTSGGEKQSGIGVHFKSLISSSNISYVSTKNISQSFKDEIKTSYSQTIEAGAYDMVLLARTPYVYYVYNKWDNINGCYLENEVVMVVEQPRVYVALTVDEYNAFVKEYLKENPDYASKLKELDPVKNNIGYEGTPASYTATEITATTFSNDKNDKYNQTDFSGGSIYNNASTEITQEQSSTITKTQTVKLNGCYGYFGLIKEIGVTTEKSWSFINASTTTSAISSTIAVSGKVCSVKGTKMSIDGISSTIMKQYAFQWKLAHWDSDIPGIDYINGSSSITNVPIIGYIVKPATSLDTLQTILAPQNVKAYIDYQYGSKEETGAISIYWDKYESSNYSIKPAKYRILWGYSFSTQYQLLGEVTGADTNRAFFTLPHLLSSWNNVCIAVQAVNDSSESLYSVKTMPVDGGTARDTDFVVNYYKEAGDTTPYAIQEYDYGAKLSFPEQPTMNPQPGQTITFEGWVNSKGTAYSTSDIVSGDLNLYASFNYGSSVYKVNFYDNDGNLIKSYNVSYGATITAPTMNDISDEKTNYTFSGWSESADSQNIVQVPSTCTESKNYYAQYSATTKYYNICFTNYLGETENSMQKQYKETFQLVAGPQRPADGLYAYTFSYWAVKSGNANQIDQTTYECVGDVTFEPVYVEIGKEYTVVFLDEQGNVLSSKSYKTNEYIIQPTTQTKYDANYTYSFSHWTTNPATQVKDYKATCQGSVTYYAVYDKEARSYMITFQNYDGSVISSSLVKYGDDIVAPQSPIKAEDNLGTYMFVGWGATVGKCYGTQTFTATFECNYKIYNVAFKDEGGNIVSNGTYHYGDLLNIPSMQPVRLQGQDEYYFSGWYKEGDETYTLVNVRNCYSSATYVAIYTYQPHTYSVTFKDANGNVLSTCSYLYGDAIVQPTAQQMAKADDERYRYEFVGFDKDIYSTCVGDEEFTAQYEKINKEYIVMYQNYDESVLGTGWKKYSYGEKLATPTNPTRADDENYSYRFIGWDNNHTGTCTGQCLYTAQYEAIPLQNKTTIKTSLDSNQLFIILAVAVFVLFIAVVVLLVLFITKKGKVVQTVNINTNGTSEGKNEGNK